MSLPSRDTTLGSSLNKIQLIEIVSEYTCSEVVKHTTLNRIFVMSANTTRMVHKGVISVCPDMETSHEEADIILVQQCFKCIEAGCSSIKVISDDTDVFVFHSKLQCEATVLMEDTHGNSRMIDIGKTSAKHHSLTSFLPAVHALTGCDSTNRFHGIGKKTALKVATHRQLPSMGLIDADRETLMTEATTFIEWCYGIEDGA